MSRPLCSDTLTVIGNLDNATTFAMISEFDSECTDLYFAYHDVMPSPVGDHELVFYSINALEGGVDTREYMALSRKFPHLNFIIDREDEVDGPMRIYCKDGKRALVYPEIVWPDFDWGNMREVENA